MGGNARHSTDADLLGTETAENTCLAQGNRMNPFFPLVMAPLSPRIGLCTVYRVGIYRLQERLDRNEYPRLGLVAIHPVGMVGK